jgi:hypothetical protein
MKGLPTIQVVSLRSRQGPHKITIMRLQRAIQSRYALSLTGISATYLGAYFVTDHHLQTGIILTLIGAFWSAAWVMTLPRLLLWGSDLTALFRFWLLVLIFAGTSAFLVQKYYDKQIYRSPAGLSVPADDKSPKSWCPPPWQCQ